MTSSPHFTNICTLPLPSDVFCQALHPTQPLLAVGLATGHVSTYRLPSTDEQDDDSSISPPPPSQPHANGNGTASILSMRRRSSTASENGLGNVETAWKTRRHKGSCRSLAYSNDGEYCYSAGTDGVLKVFEGATGTVVAKIAVPRVLSKSTSMSASTGTSEVDAPTEIYELTPMHLVVATDSGAVYIYDVRPQSKDESQEQKKKRLRTEQEQEDNNGAGFNISARPSKIEHPHRNEHVNALVPLPPSESSTSGFPKQFVSVGGSTLAVTDLRKGVVATSEDQEVELTSCLVVSGLKKGGTSVGEKVLVGQSDGVLSLWERGAWGDLDERIVVDRLGASVDALCEVPREFLPRGGSLKMNEKVVACGLDDGRIRFVRIGRNGVVPDWDIKHDDIDGVVSLLFDGAGNRLVSGGGPSVKIWTQAQITEGVQNGSGLGKRKKGYDSEDDEEWEDEDDSNEEQEPTAQYGDSDEEDSDENVNSGKRKKRKRNKGKGDSAGNALNLSGTF